MAGKLSPKQRAFVEHYLMCWNATEAARRAGYSERTAQEQGSRLLSKVMVEAAINLRISEQKATADEVLLRLASHSRRTMEDFLSAGGETIDMLKARERGVLHLVKKFKVTTTTVVDKDGDGIETHRLELELYDAQAATVQLARILGQYVERVEIHDLREKADSELIAEFQSIVDAARARAGTGDSG